MEMNHRFEALTTICLNNWHYIPHKVLTLHEGINFFTGHSGSGKSTVIDAIQIVLYASTDGRGFFNKAAADDSDRSLIEYLRGMVNIGEDNKFAYLRNKDFSSTIVLEFTDTQTRERQCVGVVFDVTTASNDMSKLFFWHKGGLPEDAYRIEGRAKSIAEIKRWLAQNFLKEEYYFGAHNERFRKQLYDIYLGGLDQEKFPRLFKRAIPFRMNIKLDEFVKEYICMEQDIHIEDMQQSVMEYGRMRKKIEDTCRELEHLQRIQTQFEAVELERKNWERTRYFQEKLEILIRQRTIADMMQKQEQQSQQLEKTEREMEEKEKEIEKLRVQSDDILRQMALTDYEQLRHQLEALRELMAQYERSKDNWEQTANRLKAWEEIEVATNQELWDIDAFCEGSIDEEALCRLQKHLAQTLEETSKEYKEYSVQLREIQKKKKNLEQELAQVKQGEKAYPKELEELRRVIQKKLSEELGKTVTVDILADLLDIPNDVWRSAVEGYLGNQKLGIVVAPEYAKRAMQIYQGLDKEKYYRYGVLHTERVQQEKHKVQSNALSTEVVCKQDYVQSYIDFLLGKVIKCENTEELTQCKIGITKECVLYHNYRIQHMDPASYTRFAYIGKNSIQQRVKVLQKEIQKLEKEKQPLTKLLQEQEQILNSEALSLDCAEYMNWKKDMAALEQKRQEEERLCKQLESAKNQNTADLETVREDLLEQIRELEKSLRNLQRVRVRIENEIETQKNIVFSMQEDLQERQNKQTMSMEYEKDFSPYYKKEKSAYEQLLADCETENVNTRLRWDKEKEELIRVRTEYLRAYPNRNFSPTTDDNKEYQELYDSLHCDRLEEFQKRATEQARVAVDHFKDDFMYKIRSAIKEALQRKDELNRIISKLDFGKDKYQFYIGRNKGADGVYYDMFMDDSLEINPSELALGMENQLNLFTMEHESQYSTMINDLIRIFIPPEHATAEELEAARRNMDKYSDYRTYLSFDMQQLIQGEDEVIKIHLSKMISKNSGGEGQNPLYVALLASFAQAYQVHTPIRERRNPTMRLVVLDEAFSKMDAEKVASCIKLMRGLGFQAIISATNDKIQNYLETVDKVFVYANPNKKSISIQQFERKHFPQLKLEEEL